MGYRVDGFVGGDCCGDGMMLGYMTAEQAKANGFTHHGKYYGIPIWMNDDEYAPMICTKWAPMEAVMTMFHYIEAFMASFLWDEPMFMFKKGKAIQ